MIVPGQPLPPFSLSDDQGRLVTDQDFQGHWSILYAYPKDATPGCTTEACDFRDSWSRVQALGARVYGLSRDGQASHAKFVQNQGLPFPLLSDPEAGLLKALGAFGIKERCGKACEGIIRSTYLVDLEGRLRRAWSPVSVKGHVQEVLDALAELQAGR